MTKLLVPRSLHAFEFAQNKQIMYFSVTLTQLHKTTFS